MVTVLWCSLNDVNAKGENYCNVPLTSRLPESESVPMHSPTTDTTPKCAGSAELPPANFRVSNLAEARKEARYRPADPLATLSNRATGVDVSRFRTGKWKACG